jgi:pimeloyl-ACP methyl ester carboxylesterase
VALATRLAFWIGGTRGRQLREITGQLYREIASDPVATQVGSVLGLARRELLQRSFNVGHYYSYVPEHAPGERPGLIVFLHGNGGNFQILPWAWRPFAECERFAVIAPTFGFGFWGKGGVAAVERAMGDARDRLPIDPGRVYLAGISDSGKGATRSAAAHPTRFRGLIYLLPTMVLKELTAPLFAVPWRDRPLFVAQGGRDWNVRPSFGRSGRRAAHGGGLSGDVRRLPRGGPLPLLRPSRGAVRIDPALDGCSGRKVGPLIRSWIGAPRLRTEQSARGPMRTTKDFAMSR